MRTLAGLYMRVQFFQHLSSQYGLKTAHYMLQPLMADSGYYEGSSNAQLQRMPQDCNAL